MGNKRYLLLALLLVVFGMFIYLGNQEGGTVPQVLASEINMEPTQQDSAGVDLDSDFVFAAADELDPKFINENIIVEPALAFTIEKSKEDPKKVLLIPQEPLEPEKIYKFTLDVEDRPLKWAFQTKGDFKVVSTLPRDKSSGVPVDTGIELNFSHLSFDKLPEYFSISPEVQGTFEVHKKTAVFIPQKLESATVYTVTLRKGLPLLNSSQTLTEDYVFQFETKSETGQQAYLNIFDNYHEFTTQEKPYFQLVFYNSRKNIEGKVTIYSYKSSLEYIKALENREEIPYWAYSGRSNYREETAPLTKVADFSVPLQGSEDISFLELPEALPAGYYLAEVSLENATQQTWFQVTDLGIYAAYANNKTLFWVNDLSNGQPLTEAQVKIIDGESAKTDNKGLAELNSPLDLTKGVYAVINKDNREGVAAIIPSGYIELGWEKRYTFQNNFWRYLYLDRSLYKPNETVNFWGLVKPRTGENTVPKKVTVAITKGEGLNEPVITSQEITVTDFNFIGKMELPNLLPGYYYLTVMVDQEILISKSFDVENFSKPAYQLEATPQRKAIFAGEKVDFQVKASFFEGTPAANIPLNYYIDNQSRQLTTNSQGEGVITYTPPYNADSYGYSDMRYLYLTADLPESGEINGEASLWVLNNDVAITNSQAKIIKEKAQIELEVNKLTLEKVNSGQMDPWESDAFIDKPAPNQVLKVQVYEEIWEKKEIGQYYDFINKKVMPRYSHQYKKVPYMEGTVTTDGEGKATFAFPIEEKSAYLVEFTTKDFRGNTAYREQRIYGLGFNLDYEYSWYHLENENPSEKYSVGEDLTLKFKKNETLVPAREKGFLFFTCREGILEGEIKDSGTFTMAFPQDLIPNFWVKGVYFDGRFYYQAPEHLIRFDEKEKALAINISTDKDEYRPGENVKVNLEVRDKNNKPTEAIVNLNLVDEALYALRDQSPNILQSLYVATIQSGLKGTLITHEPGDPRLGGAEQGGEGGSERKDFKDTVLFKTVNIDRSGQASVEFQVPDNLTSWRLTCQAITEDLEAATATAKVKVKLPFFVDMVIADTYLTGDEVIVPVRSYGSKLKEGSSVEYQLTLKSGEKVIRKETTTGQAFTAKGVPLQPLGKGMYDLTLTGKNPEGLTDTLTLSFQVVDSLVTQKKTEFFSLGNKIMLEETIDSPATIIFNDYQRSQYLNLLWRLNLVDGTRIEQRIAPSVAEKLMNEYFPDLELRKLTENNDYLNYQTPQGGISILPYSDEDLELSVKLACLNPEAFDGNALAKYFTDIANDPKESRERAIIALAGLAALDEPILKELEIISQNQDLTIKEQLYLNLALMELGDERNAAERFKTMLETKTEKLGSNLRLNVGTDQDDILEATQMAAVLAMGLDFTEEAGKLQGYVLENRTKEILLYVEQLMYLAKALPKLEDKPASFTYKLNKESKRVTLEPSQSFTLILTPEKLEEIEFSKIEGQIGVSVIYETPFEPPTKLNQDGVKITRQYEVEGKPSVEWTANDLVRIRIAYSFGPKAPDGPYEVSDFLPAGLKIVERPYKRGINDKSMGYPIMINGQKVTFLIYEKKDGHLTYYARVVNPGLFRAEQAILMHGKSGVIYSVSDKDEVNIK